MSGVVERASLSEMAVGPLPQSALFVTSMPAQLFKPCSDKMVRWETVGLLVDHGSLLLDPQGGVHLILLCTTWLVQTANERMPVVFDKKSTRRILHERHKDY